MTKEATAFSAPKLRRFVSPGFGLALNAPESWLDKSDKRVFQVVDPRTDAQFTASAYENHGLSLEQWAAARLSLVEKATPYLRQVRAPYQLEAKSHPGIAAEYQGRFPGADEESRHLVLCLSTKQFLVSVTLTVRAAALSENEALYRWLLQEQLDLYKVERIGADAAGAAKLKEFAEQGHADAQFDLGVLYASGQGVAQDRGRAVEWLRKAAGQGHQEAQALLKILEAREPR